MDRSSLYMFRTLFTIPVILATFSCKRPDYKTEFSDAKKCNENTA